MEAYLFKLTLWHRSGDLLKEAAGIEEIEEVFSAESEIHAWVIVDARVSKAKKRYAERYIAEKKKEREPEVRSAVVLYQGSNSPHLLVKMCPVRTTSREVA